MYYDVTYSRNRRKTIKRLLLFRKIFSRVQDSRMQVHVGKLVLGSQIEYSLHGRDFVSSSSTVKLDSIGESTESTQLGIYLR